MAEYIEREAAVNALTKIINESDMPEDWNKGMSAAMSALFRIPAADVRSVVKAIWKHVQWVVDEEWQDGGYWISRCSNCLMPYNTETPFCPHCGADMR